MNFHFESHTAKRETMVAHSHSKRKVSWNESVRCYLIRDCIDSSWYSDSDYARFKKDVRQTQTNVDQETESAENVCTRGLEHLVDADVYRKKLERRINAWGVVFIVQEERWRPEGRRRPCYLDIEAAIARACIRETKSSQADAHRRALEDQFEARMFGKEAQAVSPSKWNHEAKRLHSQHNMTPHFCQTMHIIGIDSASHTAAAQSA
jgi:hypothetical protein